MIRFKDILHRLTEARSINQIRKLEASIIAPRGKERIENSWRGIRYGLEYGAGLDPHNLPTFWGGRGQVGAVDVKIEGLKFPAINAEVDGRVSAHINGWVSDRKHPVQYNKLIRRSVGIVELDSLVYNPRSPLPYPKYQKPWEYHLLTDAEDVSNGNTIARVVIDDYFLIQDIIEPFYLAVSALRSTEDCKVLLDDMSEKLWRRSSELKNK